MTRRWGYPSRPYDPDSRRRDLPRGPGAGAVHRGAYVAARSSGRLPTVPSGPAPGSAPVSPDVAGWIGQLNAACCPPPPGVRTVRAGGEPPAAQRASWWRRGLAAVRAAWQRWDRCACGRQPGEVPHCPDCCLCPDCPQYGRYAAGGW